MSWVEKGSTDDLTRQSEIIYFGFEKKQLKQSMQEHKSLLSHAPFHGTENDVLLHLYTSEGHDYFAVFKAKEDDFARPINFFLSDEKKLFINANGRVYRFLVDEKSVVRIRDYDLPPTASAERYTVFSSRFNIMVIATTFGLVAINWEKELWKTKFSWANAGYLELVNTIDSSVVVESYNPTRVPNSALIELDIISGQIVHVKAHKTRWYYYYYDENDEPRIKLE